MRGCNPRMKGMPLHDSPFVCGSSVNTHGLAAPYMPRRTDYIFILSQILLKTSVRSCEFSGAPGVRISPSRAN